MTRGRRRAFDRAEALDRATRVFWDNGYAGTSMSNLTEALGISKPSLYAAFGNKGQLFEAALAHYMSRYGVPLVERLETPEDAPLRTRLRSYLLDVSDLLAGGNTPKGCLFVKSSCESGGDRFPVDLTGSLREIGFASDRALTALLRREQKRGLLSRSTDPKALANYIACVIYGLSVLARRGKSRADLRSVVDFALDALPADPG